MITNFLLILLGFVLLIKGADFLVEGASGIAKKFHILRKYGSADIILQLFQLVHQCPNYLLA